MTRRRPPNSTIDVTTLETTNRPINTGRTLDDQTSRLDAVAKVTGAARYSRDRHPDGMLLASLIRCPWGSATLESADVDAAKAVAGVVEVELSGSEGNYHGQPVGWIAAESKLALRRAKRALAPKWTRRDATTSIAHVDPAPPATPDDASLAMDLSDKAFDAVYSTPVQTHSALETHGMVVDHDGDAATVYASTQGTFATVGQVGRFLDLPQSAFRVVCEYVGGGFGAKFQIGAEGRTAARLAAKYKRPVSCFCDRDEEHLDTGNRPSSRTHVKVGLSNDGTVQGGHVHTFGGVGDARGGGGCNVPSGRYDFGVVQKTHADVRFNGGAPRAMRAPGYPQGAFAEELMIDELAATVGDDPLDYRRRLIADETGSVSKMLDVGADLIGWSARVPNGTGTGTRRRGFGVGVTDWKKLRGQAEAEVVVHRDGSVVVRTGTQDIGQGNRTAMAVVAADALGIPLARFRVQIGDSTLPVGPASGGSVTAPTTAPAIRAAATNVRTTLLESVATRESVNRESLEIRDGRILADGRPVEHFEDACRRLTTETITGRGQFSAQRPVYWGSGHSNGVQFVDLDVDIETGVIRVNRIVAVQACGVTICRKTAESQVIGGVIQGLSYALFEDRILDRVTGAMVNANLDMYKIAGANDMPHIQPVLWEDGSTGVRSLGEPPVVPTAGAIAGALYNAIGAPVRDLPITPDRVLAAIEEANA